jgi:hypothetical protein
MSLIAVQQQQEARLQEAVYASRAGFIRPSSTPAAAT